MVAYGRTRQPGLIDPTAGGLKLPAPPSLPWQAAFWADDIAVADGAAVATWADRSGYGRDLTQATSGARPTFRATSSLFNGRAAVEFDGSDDLLRTSAWIAQSQPYSYVLLFQPRTLATYNTFMDQQANVSGATFGIESGAWVLYGGSSTWSAGSPSAGTTYAARALLNAASSSVNANGSSITSGTNIGVGQSNGLTLGSSRGSSNFAAITVAFAGVYIGNITAHANWSMFTAWVAAQYGLTLA